jgi:hypothetical protein
MHLLDLQHHLGAPRLEEEAEATLRQAMQGGPSTTTTPTSVPHRVTDMTTRRMKPPAPGVEVSRKGVNGPRGGRLAPRGIGDNWPPAWVQSACPVAPHA